mgnify:CR=1 FL=1
MENNKVWFITGASKGLGLELAKKLLAETEKEIIGFDLVEVAPGENDDWDGNVGARMLFHMCGVLAKNNKMNVGDRINFPRS